MTNDQQPKFLVLGEILRPHGVIGELRMRILTDYPERFLSEIKKIYLGHNPEQDEAAPYNLKSARFHKDYLLIKLDGITSRNDAEVLRGLKVLIDIDNAVPLEEGEYYLYQLIGLTVQTEAEITLGQLRDVIETGANDVYLVKGREYGELLLPAHEETIVKIDFDKKIVTMRLPEGLLPE